MRYPLSRTSVSHRRAATVRFIPPSERRPYRAAHGSHIHAHPPQSPSQQHRRLESQKFELGTVEIVVRIDVSEKNEVWCDRFVQEAVITGDIEAALPAATAGERVIVQERMAPIGEEELSALFDGFLQGARQPRELLLESWVTSDVHDALSGGSR